MSSTQMRTRRAVFGASAGLVGLIGAAITVASPAAAVPGFALDRLQGGDRYETAAVIARDTFPNARVVLLANGQDDDGRTARNESHFPDALTGNYLAGIQSAPTLLTTETSLPAATRTALDRIRPARVIILGGVAAVSRGQEDELRRSGFTVDRVEGRNRYETAAKIARQPNPDAIGTVDGRRTAIVASGEAFPDALVTGPLSFARDLPLTITTRDRLSPETRQVLVDLKIENVVIPGGFAAVSQAVQNEIQNDLKIRVQRIDGNDRVETARKVADFAVAELAFVRTHVNLALGLKFPDALAGGPHAGRERSPILLTENVDALGVQTKDYLQDNAGTLQGGHIFGGTSAVSERVEREAEQAGQGSGSTSPLVCAFTGTTPAFGAGSTPQAVTTRPELASAALVGSPVVNSNGTTASGDDFCTTQVRFTFDEPVIGRRPDASRFVLVGFDPANRLVAQSAVIESGGTSVLATFGRGDDPATGADERQSVGAQQLLNISLAVVDQDAVVDNGGQGNPIGDQPFGQSRQTPLFTPGITAAPDLLSVRAETSRTDIVFEFDEPVTVVRNNGFHVVTSSNRDIICTAPTATGQTVRATCGITSTETAVRAFVESDSVSDTAQNAVPGADGDLNVLQAAEFDGSGTTVAPDLVSAEFGALNESPNTVLFTFDEAVFIGDGTRFQVYQQDTDEFRSASAVRQTTPTQVRATFNPDDEDGNPANGAEEPALNNAVGVSVLDGAVIQAGGQNLPNQEDELAVANRRVVDVTAGLTTGPDLTGVTINRSTTTPSAAYRFDEALSPRITFTSFLLFTPDGTRLTCQTGSLSSDRQTVTCTVFTTSGVGGLQPASSAQVENAVLGTVDNSAVQDGGGQPNPEGAEPTTGGTGKPEA